MASIWQSAFRIPMGKSEKTRKRYIEKAAVTFNTRGIGGTTVDEIIQAAEGSKGSLYSHFINKEALSYEVVDFLLDKYNQKLRAIFDSALPVTDRFYTLLRYNVNPLDFFIAGGSPMINFSTECDDGNEIVRLKVKAAFEQNIRLFCRLLQEGVDGGLLTPATPVEIFAYKVFCLIEGTGAFCRVTGDNAPMRNLIDDLQQEFDNYRIRS
ncbi:TetR/AcrR family transcriptional regulator [Mucilaginibacter celer]|uniref:TetR family transcriptional regulator n=1 Tax=Mucilaginibacter celer TaxID=2305508 RepID=A0A494VSK9_9SPHI|nr:TetR/AcrR family transcriptional regulator [Mucilaginibacter celer]AYL94343.1 TetR family transcriptional regulator [Mucilaginibacter celer]